MSYEWKITKPYTGTVVRVEENAVTIRTDIKLEPEAIFENTFEGIDDLGLKVNDRVLIKPTFIVSKI